MCSNGEKTKMGDMVTIVIPAFNAENFVGEAVKSCFNQTHRPIEIVLVNDGSKDRTAERFEKLKATLDTQNFRLRLINLKTNTGAANALNVGFSYANGSYICWLSVDDVFIEKKKIEKQLRYMKNTSAQWSYFRDCYFGGTFATAKLARGSYFLSFRMLDPLFLRDAELRLAALFFKNPINGSSVMITQKCVKSFGQFDPCTGNIDGDGDLWMRYSALNLKVSVLKGAAVFYREHPRQTSKNRTRMMYGCELTRVRMLRLIEKYGKLTNILRKFSPFLLLLSITEKYLDRPLTSEFIFGYIIKNKQDFDVLLYKEAMKALNKLKNYEIYQKIDKEKFSKDLESLMSSNTFRDFERKFRKLF